MTMSLDDHLRDLLEAGGPAPSSLKGDLGAIHATVRRRVRRRRVAVGTAAASVVLAGAATLLAGTHHDRVDVDNPATTQDTRPPTTPPSSTPLLNGVDLGSLTYTSACAGFGDHRSASLHDGHARLPGTGGAHYEVDLGPFSFANISSGDAGGSPVLIVVLRCAFVGADVDTSAQLRAYRIMPGGRLEQIASRVLQHVKDEAVDGVTVTATVDQFGPGDAACCPSSTAVQRWRFDGRRFVLVGASPSPAR
jgi:hypothetical protein